MTFEIAAALLFAVIVCLFAKKIETRIKYPDLIVPVILLFGLALILRLGLGLFSTGYTGDMEAFKYWARHTNEVGFGQIYKEDIFLDYPPGYLYVLVFLEKLRLLLGLDPADMFFTLIIKLPSILGDMFCGMVLYLLAKSRLGHLRAMFVSAIYLFCPTVLINSAVWGQADSFCLSILLGSTLLLYREKYIPSALLYGLAIVMKPQMLCFVPMYVFFAIRKRRYGMLALSTVVSVLTVLMVATPFTDNFNYSWLIGRYIDTMNSYSYYSVNAYNFWALINKNWAELPSGFAGVLLNISGPVLATLACGFVMYKCRRDEVLFIAPPVLMATVYMFTVKMHERYLYFALLTLILAYIFTPDRRLLYAFGLLAAVNYINTDYVLYLYINHGAYYDPNEPVVKLISALQLAAYFYMMYIVFRVFVQDRQLEPAKAEERSPLPIQPAVNSSFVIKDYAIMFAITLTYAVLAFSGLGDRQTAQSSWLPSTGDQVVVYSETPGNTLCFIRGIAADDEHYNARIGARVSVDISEDGESWTNVGDLKDEGESEDVYCWQLYDLMSPVSYIRLTALDGEVCLNEIGLRDEWSESYLPLSLVSGDGQNLLDEQSVIPLEPSYKNSTYFDEIYHARTAYEHMLGLEPYENTHPPLGKLLIALGIKLFGMNPFGWRFSGTLIGVLMLPCLYFLLKQLFGKTLLATAGTLLFALDFMHFTQTRIATIDSYAVFFIILMYAAMVVFIKKDLHTAGLRDVMPPLAASGIFMGLGIASKWTVAYGAVGLAVLFFGKLIYSFLALEDGYEHKKKFSAKILKLCGLCCIWFIVLPFAIYFTAFLPMTTLSHNSPWASFINYQSSMYSYHSGLDATHFYSSPWYDWPFIIKPICYYSNGSMRDPSMGKIIVSMGNPALWWPGALALPAAIILLFKRRERAAFVAVIGFLSVYLPWVLVSRIAFIYHYFTAIPFLIVAIVYIFKLALDSQVGKFQLLQAGALRLSYVQLGIWLYVILNLILFIMFFPVISGIPVRKEYLTWLQWLPEWYLTP